jgi:hypothetical protein
MATSTYIQLEKVQHRDKMVTLLRFAGRRDWLTKIKSLSISKFTRTHGCYYIDYDLDAFNAFVQLQLPYRLPAKAVDNSLGTTQGSQAAQCKTDIATTTPPPSSTIDPEQDAIADIHHCQDGDLEITYRNRYFYLTTPYDPTTVSLIKQLPKAYWHKEQQRWVCYATVENLRRIQKYWSCWTMHQLETLTTVIKAYDKGTTVTLYHVPTYVQEVAVELTGYRQLQAPLRRCKNRRYDKQVKRWYIPYQASIIEQLITDYKSMGVHVINRLPEAQLDKQVVESNGQRGRKILRKVPAHCQKIATTMIDAMILRRHSWRTIEQYTRHVTKYYDYLHKEHEGQTSQHTIDLYMTIYAKRKISDSLLNIVASALKYYYRHIEPHHQIDVTLVKRPITTTRHRQYQSNPKTNRYTNKPQAPKHSIRLVQWRSAIVGITCVTTKGHQLGSQADLRQRRQRKER